MPPVVPPGSRQSCRLPCPQQQALPHSPKARASRSAHSPRDSLSLTSIGAQAQEFNRFFGADQNANYYVATFGVGASDCPAGQVGASCTGLGGRQTARKIAPSGAAVTVVSGDALYPGTTQTIDSTGTQFKNLAVDKNGVVYIADMTNKTVLMVAASGAVSVFAGTFRERGDVDGPAAQPPRRASRSRKRLQSMVRATCMSLTAVIRQ